MVLSMIDSKKVIRFFDDCAAGWDAGMVKNDGILEKVLDCAETGRGKSVLDIGCGTGVLFPYYLARGVSSLVGVDFSPKMAAIAAENVKGIPSCEVLCEDALSLPFRGEFDVCVVYNALPHFPDPAALIAAAFRYLKKAGTLTIAHGMSREAVNRHHRGVMEISEPLMPADDLAKLFQPYFRLTSVISDDEKYIVSGKKLQPVFSGQTGKR